MAKRNISPKSPLVYLVINKINGYRYIGSTKCMLCQRKSGHFQGARHGRTELKLYDAIREFGEESFEFTTLKYYNTLEEARSGEKFYIKTMNPEYNIAHTPKHKISEKNRENLSRLGKENNTEWQRKYAHLGPKSIAKKVLCLNDGIIHESASSAARYYDSAKSAVIEMCLRKKLSSGAIRRSVNGRKFKYIES